MGSSEQSSGSTITWRIGFICGNLSRVHEAARAFHTGQDRQRHALHRIRCHCRFGHLFRIHDVNTQILQDPAHRMLSGPGHALSDESPLGSVEITGDDEEGISQGRSPVLSQATHLRLLCSALLEGPDGRKRPLLWRFL